MFIQWQVGLSTYDRDIGILTELKEYEGKLEMIRNELIQLPKLMETNNSMMADFIRANNLEMIQVIKDQNKK